MNIEIILMKEEKEKEGGTKLVLSSKLVLKGISTPVLYLGLVAHLHHCSYS
jgi:hypothetical protein